MRSNKIACDACGFEELEVDDRGINARSPEDRGWGRLTIAGTVLDVCRGCVAKIRGERPLDVEEVGATSHAMLTGSRP